MASWNSGQSKGLDWIKAHFDYQGDDCLLWPFSTTWNGYGQVCTAGGQVRRASRVICEMVHGPAPSPRHQAAHSCGCANPRHISWKTRSQNEADKRRHGTAHFSGKPNPFGLRGITLRSKRWLATISIEGRQIRLGSFKTKDEAIAAYDAAAIIVAIDGRVYPLNRDAPSLALQEPQAIAQTRDSQ